MTGFGGGRCYRIIAIYYFRGEAKFHFLLKFLNFLKKVIFFLNFFFDHESLPLFFRFSKTKPCLSRVSSLGGNL